MYPLMFAITVAPAALKDGNLNINPDIEPAISNELGSSLVYVSNLVDLLVCRFYRSYRMSIALFRDE